MTDDIIERLSDLWPDHPAERKLIGDAMTEITLLQSSVNSLISERDAERAENERLREALRDIERGDYSDPMCVRTPEQRAREALEAKP